MDQHTALRKSLDLSHHFSAIARRRQNSPLKEFQKLIGNNPNLISLAGGMPNPAYFPFDSIGGQALAPDTFPANDSRKTPFSWLWNMFSSSELETLSITVPKYPQQQEDVNLATALQYGVVTGIPQLGKIVKEFTARVHRPAYEDFATTINAGSTDGWTKVLETFCNPGDVVLMGEYTYSTAVITARPYQCTPFPVKMDAQGIRADALRDALSSWDTEAQGHPRPHVLYVVPVGQNPTGAMMSLDRKKAIYKVCVDFDVIIIEDDPYFFMQEGSWVPRNKRPSSKPFPREGIPNETYLSKLIPSFASIDYQGRVVRLDTFSKTIAPGCRMGWYTCNPLFAERLERCTETSTQQPCGFGQSLVSSLLLKWGPEGYMRWLQGITKVYTKRRDLLVDKLDEAFQLLEANDLGGIYTGAKAYLAYDLVPPGEEKALVHPLFTFVPPSSGMFIWITVHFKFHPSFQDEGEQSLELKLFIALAKAGLVIIPGNSFDTAPDSPLFGHDSRKEGHYRMSFAHADPDTMAKAVAILAKVLRAFFRARLDSTPAISIN